MCKKVRTQNQAVNGLVVKVSQGMKSMKETKIPAALNEKCGRLTTYKGTK